MTENIYKHSINTKISASQTFHEKILWEILRKKRQEVKFRRQKILYGKKYSFYCPLLKLLIDINNNSPRFIECGKYNVLIFNENEIENDLELVVSIIKNEIIKLGKIRSSINNLLNKKFYI